MANIISIRSHDVLYEFPLLNAGGYEVGQPHVALFRVRQQHPILSAAMRWPRMLPRMVTL